MQRNKARSIPVNHFEGEYHSRMSIEKMDMNDIPDFEMDAQSERHDRHTFHLLEKGMIVIEIDFNKYEIRCPSIIYMHPDQVHRIVSFENVIVSTWAIKDEDLNPEYLKLLEGICPAKPLALYEEMFSLFSEAVSLFLKFYERRTDTLYHSFLKDSCNALVALFVSQYSELSASTNRPARFELVSKAFRELLERNYTRLKRPAAYAQKLNLSTPYLNECVKNTTGHPVSYHIQQRVILEAKRLLYHSDSSVKEISAALGYDDQPYFSRLFAKVTGMSALAFRNKNHD